MALDSQIPLGVVQPKFNTPFESLGQIQQLRAQQQEIELRRQQIAASKAEEELRRQKLAKDQASESEKNTVAQIISQPGISLDDAEKAIAQKAPGQLEAFRTERQKHEETAAKIAKDVADTTQSLSSAQKSAADAQTSAQTFVANDAQQVLALPSALHGAVLNLKLQSYEKAFPQSKEAIDNIRQQIAAGVDPTQLLQGLVKTSPQQANADTNAQTAQAELPGKIANSQIQQQVAAGTQGGLTPEQQSANTLRGREVTAQEQNARTNAAREGREAKTAAGADVQIAPNTPQYKTAQDLAYGKMSFQQFRTLVAYGRDPNLKMGIYAKAAELNPDFNPVDFERGLKFMSNPKVSQQLASLDNVVSGVPDLLKASDLAQRSGATTLNKFIVPVAIGIGSKRFSNLNTARTAFADELSGALGYGSATDMSREMGFNMADQNLSPENFKSAIQDVIIPFVERKRASLLKQGSIYGKPENNSAISPAPTTPVEEWVRDKNGKLVKKGSQ